MCHYCKTQNPFPFGMDVSGRQDYDETQNKPGGRISLHHLQCLIFHNSYFKNLLRPKPAMPIRPAPRSIMVAGSGTGEIPLLDAVSGV